MSELKIGAEPRIFSHRNNADLPKSTLDDLTERGIGVGDWGMGLSWDYAQVKEDNQAAAKTFTENLLTINEHGGYGVIHTKEYEKTVIGRISPPCVRFMTLEGTSGTERMFKAFEFEEFASVNLRKDYPELHDRLANIAHLGTTSEVGDGFEELVTDAFVDLESSGVIR
ncbi:hypothetical protein [Haloarcula sebkhae]|uniref:Uncharacterized protein n=2 Tax=Haloarcula sebkhae TaxID=932660 RepID=A0ACC6VND6_9EURY|nr:hypothetical protein [Haloarcula sebkhae]GGK83325.1 hypothetical protein GCM10009067_39470 [Haloarcula sebkhae]